MSRPISRHPAIAHHRTRGAVGRRTLSWLVAVVVVASLAIVIASEVNHAVSRLGLPLTNADVIRKQAAEKRLDPALVAAVIYAESKFEPRPSSAGAEGLMQILPETAYFIAHLSGGTQFTASDLSTPSINVAYGTYYLRYLLDHYNGEEMLAVAAYNAGLANVDRWVARAHAEGTSLTVAAIPFPETHAYVERVLSAQRDYRSAYARQLGLAN
ncbi:MAG TPA: lytic transglycosylase domain-containing protein [Solirubrobacteraceae bacterium]|jgi:soluble lytic murein transglycosylase|nr:lytic transglycosylase domain-containing protein [Solirubrobacteraceae bacterium]